MALLGPAGSGSTQAGIIMTASTAPPAGVEIAGSIIEGGVECPLFRTTDGRVFALDGVAKRKFSPGRSLRLRGREVAMSICQQGRSFLVTEILD